MSPAIEGLVCRAFFGLTSSSIDFDVSVDLVHTLYELSVAV